MTPAEATEALDGITNALKIGADGRIELDPRMLWMPHAAVLERAKALNEISLKVSDASAR